MRKALAEEEGERKKFQATFVKFGKKTNYRGHSEETVLLKNIVDVESKKIVADHVWFTYTKSFQRIQMKGGSPIEFEARIKKYNKGYVNRHFKIDNRTTDYKLSHPTKICLKVG
jgi:hypothetical protein